MCVSPKKILYRSNHFDVVQHPFYLYVPCGHCEECAAKQRSDWFVRSYFEFLENQGRTFFYTLTYNPEHLPMFGKYAGFSKRHIQLFIKRLRKQLDVVGIRLKYLITCEYGECRQRPHYHAIFFLSQWYNPFTFYKLVEYEWSVCDNKNVRHSLGFVKPGDNCGIVQGTAGIRYVTKYIVKDFSYMGDYELPLRKYFYNRYLTLFSYCKMRFGYSFDAPIGKIDNKIPCFKLPERVEDLSHFQQDIIRKFVNKFNRSLRSALPFHLQSTQLGLGAFHRLSQEEIYQTPIFEKLDKQNWKLPVLDSQGFVEYSIPRYVQRKLWFDCLENEKDGKRTRFVLNEEGIKHKLSTLESEISKREEEIEECKFTAHSLSEIDTELLLMVNSALPKVSFESVYDLQYFVHHMDIPARQLAIYDVVYRGRCCDLDLFDLPDIDCLFDSYEDVFEYHLRSFSFVDIGKVYKTDRHFIRLIESCLFDNHPLLKPYELCCIVLDSLQIALRNQSCYYKAKHERDLRYLRQVMQPLN